MEIATCGEDEIESKLSSQIFSTLTTRKKYLETDFFFGNRQNPVNKCLDLVFGKQVSGYGSGKQVSGNRCLIFWGETGVGKQVS